MVFYKLLCELCYGLPLTIMIIGIQNLKKKVESVDANGVRNCKLEHYTAAIDLCQSNLVGDSRSLQQLHQKYCSNPTVVLMPMELNIVMN